MPGDGKTHDVCLSGNSETIKSRRNVNGADVHVSLQSNNNTCFQENARIDKVDSHHGCLRRQPKRKLCSLPFRCQVSVGNAIMPAESVFVEEDPDVSHAQRNSRENL